MKPPATTDVLFAEIDRLKAELAKKDAALREIVSIEIRVGAVCAWCEQRVGNGHYRNCPHRIASAAITRANGGA